jgi:hypothetical protein
MDKQVFYDDDEEEETNVEEVRSLGCTTVIIISVGLFILVAIVLGIRLLFI